MLTTPRKHGGSSVAKITLHSALFFYLNKFTVTIRHTDSLTADIFPWVFSKSSQFRRKCWIYQRRRIQTDSPCLISGTIGTSELRRARELDQSLAELNLCACLMTDSKLRARELWRDKNPPTRAHCLSSTEPQEGGLTQHHGVVCGGGGVAPTTTVVTPPLSGMGPGCAQKTHKVYNENYM